MWTCTCIISNISQKYFDNVPVTPLPKPTVRVPEVPKLQESHYAELQLEGYQRPFQRIPEDPVVYASVTKKVITQDITTRHNYHEISS